MLSTFIKFSEYLAKGKISFINKGLNDVMRSYSFYHVNQNIENLQNDIFLNFNESRIIIINQNIKSDPKADELYFFISFQKTVIIIKQTSIKFLKSLFSIKKGLKICFLSNSKENFEKNIKIQYQEIENNFQEEIKSFSDNLNYKRPPGISFLEVRKLIFSCISGYLITNSYEKLNKNRIDNFFTKRKEEKKLMKNLKKEEYIILRSLGNGSIFTANLIYHIKKEELFVIKQSYGNDSEIPKLNEREIENYSSISHPFLPEFYGTTKDNYLIIEFIDGCTLESIEKKHLSYDEKIIIIFEILMVFRYLHKRNYIFRDLKPNNIMIDRNKTVVLIDFDRMVKFNHISWNSTDFGHDYAAPEIKLGMKPTEECDIYSIGKMIYYILLEKQEVVDDISNNLNKFIKLIYEACIREAPKDRPNTFVLISLFLTNSYSILKNCQILSENKEYSDFFEIEMFKEVNNYMDNQNDSEIMNSYGLFYLQGSKKDVNLAINYFKKAASKGNINAQYNLGTIYENNEIVQRNIDMSINYYTLAANQNHSESQNRLGNIFFKGKYVPKDINKAIYYFKLSANQNNPSAQYNLGSYYENYVHDIKKALYYYNLSANQNYRKALFMLGNFYFRGQYVERNKNKAVHYLSLAADQNYIPAITYLGLIYENDPPDWESNSINKAINYYSIASKQNDSLSQYKLGSYYYEGKYLPQDINRALHYFFLAANQNLPDAQYALGRFYFDKDLNKSIYYYALATNQNYLDSQNILGDIYNSKKLKVYNPGKAIYFYELAAKNNNPKAQYNLYVFYMIGDHVKRDVNKAIHYVSLAANQGLPEALFNIGYFCSNGYYMQRDITKAIYCYKLAAAKKLPQANHNLALLYETGKYVSRDIKKAIYYYESSAKANYLPSIYNLAKIYLEGTLVNRDVNKAIYYYKLASNQNNFESQISLG